MTRANIVTFLKHRGINNLYVRGGNRLPLEKISDKQLYAVFCSCKEREAKKKAALAYIEKGGQLVFNI